MRRWAFYLSVALLAFGIGSFIAFSFYWQPTNNLQTMQKSENLIETEKTIISSQDNFVPNDFPGDEQLRRWQSDSFKPIIEKWLKGEKLDEIYDLKRSDDYSTNSQEIAQTHLIDVNGDGKKELVLRTGCAAVGNCEFWLFQRFGKNYKVILEADMVQRFSLRKNKTNSYFDLETKSHGSAVSGGIETYKFNGEEYKIDKCFNYEYETVVKNGESVYTKDKQLVTKNKPTLTPTSCEAHE